MASSNIIELILKVKDLTKADLTSAQKNIAGLKGAADSVAGSVLNLKNAFIGLGGTVVLGSIAKEFTQFDDTMRQAGAVSSATAGQMADMTAIAKEMGATTRYTATNAATALKMMGMASFTASQQITALPGVLQLAAAGSMDLGQAADIATNILTAYGMQAGEIGRVNDVMVKAFTSSNSTLQELGEGFKYVAPIAKGLGTNFENLVGTLGALHNAGIKGSMAGTTLRGVLDALYNPTNDEAELLGELSARIGGVGLQIKDTDGNFVGFTEIVRQLENSSIGADEALRLFGLRAGPGMAALISQGSGALAEMDKKLLESGGTAARIAKEMEAGLGGAWRSLVSAWEGLKIAIGEGFEAGLKSAVEYLRDLFRDLAGTIEQLKTSGSLQAWGNELSAVFQRIVAALTTLGSWFMKLLDFLEPVLKRMLDLAPIIIAGAVAIKGLGIALGLTKTVLTVFNALLGVQTLVVWAKHVQTASTYAGVFKVAISSLNAALVVAGASLLAFGVGWQLGKLIGEVELFEISFGLIGKEGQTINEVVQNLYDTFVNFFNSAPDGLKKVLNVMAEIATLGMWDSGIKGSQDMIDSINPLLERLDKFKNFKLPDDFANSGVVAINNFGKELNKAILYWKAYLRKQELVKKQAVETWGAQSIQAQAAEAVIQRASYALEELIKQQVKFNTAVSSEEQALRDAENAMSEHVQKIKDSRDKRLKDLDELLQKELLAEEQNFLAKEGVYADADAWEKYSEKRTEITEKYQKQENDIRRDGAKKIQALSEDAFTIAQARYDKDLALLNEKLQAEIISRTDANKERLRIEFEFDKQRQDILGGMGQAIVDTERNIAIDAFNSRYEAFSLSLSKEKADLDEHTKFVQMQYEKGAMSAEAAAESKWGVEQEYYNKQIAKINELAEESLKAGNTEKFKELLDARKKLQEEYGTAELDYYKNLQMQKEALQDAELALANAQYQQQLADIDRYEQAGVYSAYEAVQAKKQAEIDFLQFKLEQVNAATQAVIEAAATETAEYKNALAQRMQAQTEIDTAQTAMETARATHNKELRQAYDDTQAAATETGDTIDDTAEKMDKLTSRTVTLKDKVSEYFNLYADMSREQFTVIKQQAESMDKLMQSFAISGTPLTEQQSAWVTQTRAVEQAWKDLGDTASAVGLNIRDLSLEAGGGLKQLSEDSLFFGKNLAESAAIVQGITQLWTDFNTAIAGTTTDIQTLQTEFSNLGTDTVTQFQLSADAAESLQAGISEVQRALEQGNIEGAERMSEKVIDAYERIYDDASETLDDLKSEWQEYGDKAIEINEKIADLNKSTEETIRDLRRDLMTEEEQWQDKRLEYEEKYAEASKLLAEGAIEQAVETYKEAAGIAKNLAAEVQDTNGTVVASLETNTATSIDLIKKASEAATAALQQQQSDLLTHQDTVKTQINSTLSDLTALSTSINSMQSEFKIDFTGEGSEILPLSNKIKWAHGAVREFSDEIGLLNPKFNIDFSAANAGIEATGQALAALKQTAENTGKVALSALSALNKQVGSGGGSIPLAGLFKSAKGYAGGGFVPGTGNKDTVPAMLMPGELVIPEDITEKFFKPLFMASGGFVTPKWESMTPIWEKMAAQPDNSGLNWQKGLKNMGKLDIAIGGTEIGTVMGEQNVLDKLNTELRRKRLTA
jgi:TP901 family phage tail tape measure protein